MTVQLIDEFQGVGNLTNTTAENQTEHHDYGKAPVLEVSDRIENIIAMYISPIVVLLGLIGNILNIMILTRKRSRASSTRTLLCCLSIMDTLVLAVQVPYILLAYFDWFDATAFTANAFYVCHIRYPLTNFGLSAVAWLSASVSIDRFASVMNVGSLHRFLKRRARLVGISIILASLLLNSLRLVHFKPVDAVGPYTVTKSRSYCQPTALASGTLFGVVVDYLSALLNTLVPTTCMIVFGTIIVVKLVNIKRVRRVLFLRNSVSLSQTQSPTMQPHVGDQAIDTSLTVTHENTTGNGQKTSLLGRVKLNEENETVKRTDNSNNHDDRPTPTGQNKVLLFMEKAEKKPLKLSVTGTQTIGNERFARTDKRISLATKMVVATISLFLLSGLPSLLLTTASAIFGRLIYEYDAVKSLRHISNLLIFINVSFCFLLYCCTCSKYRRAVRKLMYKKKRPGRTGDAAEVLHSTTAGFMMVRSISGHGNRLLTQPFISFNTDDSNNYTD